MSETSVGPDVWEAVGRIYTDTNLTVDERREAVDALLEHAGYRSDEQQGITFFDAFKLVAAAFVIVGWIASTDWWFGFSNWSQWYAIPVRAAWFVVGVVAVWTVLRDGD